MKILHLSLKKAPFDVMVTGEKNFEVREKGRWINSRLFESDGGNKYYDFVKFTNGYGKDRPYFIAKYKGYKELPNIHRVFSNGFTLKIGNGEYFWVINLGEIIERGNLK